MNTAAVIFVYNIIIIRVLHAVKCLAENAKTSLYINDSTDIMVKTNCFISIFVFFPAAARGVLTEYQGVLRILL